MSWSEYRIAPDGTHHLYAEAPAYPARFRHVLPFHTPGLAPVKDSSGAYHIHPNGMPLYPSRYRQTFGFYEGFAAVEGADGWFHIDTQGGVLYASRYLWCGNFQGKRCTVRSPEGYRHITQTGEPAYQELYAYAGDFREGYAVIQLPNGSHTHIDAQGRLLHEHVFLDLDVYHKGYARARDERGWHHIDKEGKALYGNRYAMVEPFYNGVARVEDFEGALLLLNEQGETLGTLRKPDRKAVFHSLSADMVGFWKTQTIGAAARLGIFDLLPNSCEDIAESVGAPGATTGRLLAALAELKLVEQRTGVWHATRRGAFLQSNHPVSLRTAATMWAGDHYERWGQADRAVLSPPTQDYFEKLGKQQSAMKGAQQAFASYALIDYAELPDRIAWHQHQHVLDAGGGSGGLLGILLKRFPHLQGSLLDRPEVLAETKLPEAFEHRIQLLPGDLRAQWPIKTDAIVLARVLHDWPDEMAVILLRNAANALQKGGRLYVIDWVMDEMSPAGALLDLNMLVMTGGKERTEKEFRSLFDAAGLALTDRVPLQSQTSILTARLR